MVSPSQWLSDFCIGNINKVSIYYKGYLHKVKKMFGMLLLNWSNIWDKVGSTFSFCDVHSSYSVHPAPLPFHCFYIPPPLPFHCLYIKNVFFSSFFFNPKLPGCCAGFLQGCWICWSKGISPGSCSTRRPGRQTWEMLRWMYNYVKRITTKSLSTYLSLFYP